MSPIQLVLGSDALLSSTLVGIGNFGAACSSSVPPRDQTQWGPVSLGNSYCSDSNPTRNFDFAFAVFGKNSVGIDFESLVVVSFGYCPG